jgi:hypothetical protein
MPAYYKSAKRSGQLGEVGTTVCVQTGACEPKLTVRVLRRIGR